MKVYLETSYVSACVSTRSDAKSVYRRDVSLEWWNTQRKFHFVYVSDEVIQELSNPSYPNKIQALSFIENVPELSLTPEVVSVADLFVREKVMPQTLTGDAMHVACATVNAMQYMLSWNVRHLANPNKREHLQKVLLKIGRIPPEIVTPDLLWRA